MSKTPEHILKKIQITKEKRLKKLDLRWLYRGEPLTEIPIEVFDLEQLEVLDLGNNQLTTVPDALAQLHNLTTLDLSYNPITGIFPQILKLKRLHNLKQLYLRLVFLF